MDDPWAIFNSTLALSNVTVTSAYTNQSTGVYTAEATTETSVIGHVVDIMDEQLSRLPEGIYRDGDREFYTSTKLRAGDRLKITEPDSTTTYWEIVNDAHDTHFIFSQLGIRRYKYHITKTLATATPVVV